jgi:hypothetical protein
MWTLLTTLVLADPGCIAASGDDVTCAPAPLPNVLGTPLTTCDPATGFHRDGICRTSAADRGNHSVCAVMTTVFLEATKAKGNDLTTPRPDLRFPGLRAGDRWCLCASRWEEARREGHAPGVVLEATAPEALRSTTLPHLQAHPAAGQ